MLTAIEQLILAIRDEGKYPNYHREVMRLHRHQWPTLWAAIDRLIEEYEAENEH